MHGIKTAVACGSPIRELAYTYDARARITDKVDNAVAQGNTTTETFSYLDAQGRLSAWTFDQSISNASGNHTFSLDYSYEHDDLGNVTFKTDAGDMTYDPLRIVLTHAPLKTLQRLMSMMPMVIC